MKRLRVRYEGMEEHVVHFEVNPQLENQSVTPSLGPLFSAGFAAAKEQDRAALLLAREALEGFKWACAGEPHPDDCLRERALAAVREVVE